MPMHDSWLDKIASVLGETSDSMSLANIQRKLDETGSDNELASTVTAPASAGIDVLSTIGRPIAAIGGALGAGGSEAAEGAPAGDKLKMMWEGAKQGWGEGDDTFKNTVTGLDVASLGLGAVPGLVGKGATALRLARAAELGQLGISAADATMGAGQTYEGVRDKDWAKAGMGAFRVGMNAHGGLKSAHALSEMGPVGGAELDTPHWSTPNPDGRKTRYRYDSPQGNQFLVRSDDATKDAAVALAKNRPAMEDLGSMADHIHDLQSAMKDDGIYENVRNASEANFVGDASDEAIDAGVKKFAGFNYGGAKEYGSTYMNDPQKPFFVNPAAMAKRVRDDMSFLLEKDVEPVILEKAISTLPEDVATYVRGIRAGEARIPELEDKYSAMLFVRNLDYTASHEPIGHWSGGHRQAIVDDLDTANRYKKVTPEYKDLMYAKDGTQFEAFPKQVSMDDPMRRGMTTFEPAHNAVVTALNDPTRLVAFKERMSTPEFMAQAKRWYQRASDMIDDGPVAKRSDRVVGRAEAKAWDKVYAEEVPGEPPPPPNGVVRLYRGEPSTLPPKSKELLPTGFEGSYYTANREAANWFAGKNGIVYSVDVPQHLAEQYKHTGKWAEEYQLPKELQDTRSVLSQSGQPPTPPGQAPPGSSEPIGPQLQPLTQRIKMALTEHQRAVNVNQLKKAEINTMRAELLRQNEEKLFGQQITSDEFAAESKRIMSGQYDLIGKVDPLTLQGGEAPDFMQKIAAQSNDDAFVRQRSQIAFDKMVKGQRLDDNEITLMRQVIGDRQETAAADPLIKRLGEFFANTTGSARALMTAYDLSAAGRQGLFASVMNPVEAARSFKAQFDALKMTRPEFESMMLRLQDPAFNPYAEVAKGAGLHFSESMQKGTAATTEEMFTHGKWAEALPGVRRTEQAYIAYLNKLRVELFNKHLRVMEQSGIPLFDADMAVSQPVKDLAYMVNTLTGRGEMSLLHISPVSTLGKKMGLTETYAPGKEAMDKMHSGLTSVFFAPRFAASRAALMRDTVQAMLGGGLAPEVSKIYMKNVIGTIGAMTSVAGGLAAMGVGTFNYDPRKKDFGVLKVGKTRYDLYGGLKPWAKIVSVIGSDKYFSGRNRVPQRYGEGPMSKTKTGELGRFVQSKFSPMTGFIVEAMTGEDFMGRKSHLWKNAYGHTVPMIAQTIVDLYNEDEMEQLPYAVPAAVLGLGVNTYNERRFNKRDR